MEKKSTIIRRKIIAVLVLLAAWQLLSCLVNRIIFLPSVPDTLRALARLAHTGNFYRSVGTSFLRIAAGFALAVTTGVLLAVLAELNAQLGEILQLLMQLIKSIPVASFVILVLLWVRSAQLSIVISFLMVLPVIFTNVRGGIRQTDKKLLEMAQVFDLKISQKIRYIYLPAVRPAFTTACSVGLGFCWKSGIAAEVIGLPAYSIGLQLYEAKLYLLTPELFAWTIVIVLISTLFERAVMYLVRGRQIRRQRIQKHVSRRQIQGQHTQEQNIRQQRTRGQHTQSQHIRQLHSQEQYTEAQHKQRPEHIDSGHTWPADRLDAASIVVKSLRKQFNDQLVLSDVSLSVSSGERLCIMGASGIGKTTLLLILAGLEKPDSGEVTSAERGRLVMVFQEDRLLEGEDAFTNVAVVLKAFGNRQVVSPHGAAHITKPGVSADCLQDRLRREFEQIGLTSYEGKPVADFSGGMRRRVAIVRAVCADADLILLDEPFKGLDEQSRIQTARYIRERLAGRTLIAVTHDAADAKLLDAGIWVLKSQKDRQ
ncbi:MAG: ATP-binding cassette domain-containing protein [Lachnospiraceae bacterium]|nr:ATP-binding cassette domain-containing protein [Lachnospiraceae bacterium]